MPDCPSLLPPNHTSLELALEKTPCDVTDRSMPHRDLWNPDTCPVELLPWLAWAMSVDVWNVKWPQSIKRNVIKNSISLHSIKGTQGAVEDALLALGVNVEVIEWWQTKPAGERGTMELILRLDQNILPDADAIISRDLIQDLIQQIKHVKRSCIHYTLTIAIDTEMVGVTVAQSSQLLTDSRIDAMQRDVSIKPSGTVGFGAAQSSQIMTHSHMDAMQRDVSIKTSGAVGATVVQSSQLMTHSNVDAMQRDVAINSQVFTPLLVMTAQLFVEVRL